MRHIWRDRAAARSFHVPVLAVARNVRVVVLVDADAVYS